MADFFTMTANNPGIDGNRINFNLIGVTDGSMVAVAVVASDFNRRTVNITVGYNAGTNNLNIGSWQDVAAAVNASPAGAFVTCSGNADVPSQFDLTGGQLSDGWEGNGLVL